MVSFWLIKTGCLAGWTSVSPFHICLFILVCISVDSLWFALLAIYWNLIGWVILMESCLAREEHAHELFILTQTPSFTLCSIGSSWKNLLFLLFHSTFLYYSTHHPSLMHHYISNVCPAHCHHSLENGRAASLLLRAILHSFPPKWCL